MGSQPQEGHGTPSPAIFARIVQNLPVRAHSKAHAHRALHRQRRVEPETAAGADHGTGEEQIRNESQHRHQRDGVGLAKAHGQRLHAVVGVLGDVARVVGGLAEEVIENCQAQALGPQRFLAACGVGAVAEVEHHCVCSEETHADGDEEGLGLAELLNILAD
ncbi:hypothetical protein NUU61_009275 [Penicillium alfredii]|uniref:Uncharacterized protein n=1 Tax=Penicillium alfredii TaxID=1506179 RepID=A0A9W9EMT6_9EURO|nr:uncharacterized protein NUU61_009275 [Penicillium alfredii]KAJ5084696.1 hypothetical protein NUU61_009275 [Penicillium alfredii]